jgi:hypothetical protein
MGVTYASRDLALHLVAGKVKPVDVVLDLGPGIYPQSFVKARVHICVEAHLPYLEHIKRKHRGEPRYVLINSTWDQVIRMLPDKSVDTVFALDFIEHLEKEDGLKMLCEAQRVARRQVVVFTPHGLFPQSYDPSKLDRWGMDGGYWQTHRSGWDLEDFGEHWDFVVCPDCLLLDENNQPMEKPMGAIWAFRNLTHDPDPSHATAEARTTFEFFRTILEQGLPPIAFRGMRSAWIAFLHARRRIP